MCDFCRGFKFSKRFLEPSGAFWQRVRFPAFFFSNHVAFPWNLRSAEPLTNTLDLQQPRNPQKKSSAKINTILKGEVTLKKSIFSSPASQSTFAGFSSSKGSIHSLRVRPSWPQGSRFCAFSAEGSNFLNVFSNPCAFSRTIKAARRQRVRDFARFLELSGAFWPKIHDFARFFGPFGGRAQRQAACKWRIRGRRSEKLFVFSNPHGAFSHRVRVSAFFFNPLAHLWKRVRVFVRFLEPPGAFRQRVRFQG